MTPLETKQSEPLSILIIINIKRHVCPIGLIYGYSKYVYSVQSKNVLIFPSCESLLLIYLCYFVN